MHHRIRPALVCVLIAIPSLLHASDLIVIRASQIGYLPGDPKIAILSASTPQAGKFTVGEFTADVGPDQGAWGPFKHNYRLDFSTLRMPGKHQIRVGKTVSLPFEIGENIYAPVTAKCLEFM